MRFLHSHHHAASSDPEKGETPGKLLSELPSGQSAVVRELGGGKEFVARVATLGFTPGAHITVVQNYGHGPLIVALRGGHIALGRGEAGKIQVEAL